MANPNIVNVTTINGTTAYVLPASTAVSVAWTYADPNTSGSVSLTGLTPASGTVNKINNIVVTNVDGSAAADVTIEYNTLAAGTGTPYRLASTISVPADASLIVTDKSTSFYLEENTSLKGFASANSDIEVFVSYEVLS